MILRVVQRQHSRSLQQFLDFWDVLTLLICMPCTVAPPKSQELTPAWLSKVLDPRKMWIDPLNMIPNLWLPNWFPHFKPALCKFLAQVMHQEIQKLFSWRMSRHCPKRAMRVSSFSSGFAVRIPTNLFVASFRTWLWLKLRKDGKHDHF